MTSLPRAAVLHPELRGGAGSEATALWLAQALAGVCRVTLVSMGPVDLPKLDEIYGTSLSSGGAQTVSIPFPRGLARRFDALRSYRLEAQGYFGLTRKSSKYVTESATVQRPTRPGPRKVLSTAESRRR